MKNPKNLNKNVKKQHDSVIIFGRHAVISALNNRHRKCFQLLVTTLDLVKEIATAAPHLQIDPLIRKVDPHLLRELLPENAVHQGIIGEFSLLPEYHLEDWLRTAQETTSTILLLDQVTDPHNVGAILRSAAAFGVQAIITTRHNAPDESGTIAKAASGALEIVKMIKVTNLVKTITTLKEAGYWCLGLDGSAEFALHQAPQYEKVALILGSEGKGLRRLTQQHCDLLVKLPINQIVESLNVSNAAAIALYELARRNF